MAIIQGEKFNFQVISVDLRKLLQSHKMWRFSELKSDGLHGKQYLSLFSANGLRV